MKTSATKSYGQPPVKEKGVVKRDQEATKPKPTTKNPLLQKKRPKTPVTPPKPVKEPKKPLPQPVEEPVQTEEKLQPPVEAEKPTPADLEEEVKFIEETEPEPETDEDTKPVEEEKKEPLPAEDTNAQEKNNEISIRMSWSPKGQTGHLGTIGLDAVNVADQMSPRRTTKDGKVVLGYKDKLARTVSNYPGVKYTAKELRNPDIVLEKFISHLEGNLIWLYHQVAEDVRTKTKQWYDSANKVTKQFAEDYGFSHAQVAGAVAALSPQNPWDNNLALAKRLMDVYKNHKNQPWDAKMDAVANDLQMIPTQSFTFNKKVDELRGKTFHQIKDKDPDELAVKQALWIRIYDEAHNALTNEMYAPDGRVVGESDMLRSWIGLDHIAKAVKILDNGTKDNINDVMGFGHKIRNFYNNIINPNSESGYVTIDTHAVAAATLQPLGTNDTEATHNFGNSPVGIPGAPKHSATGLRGTYPLYAEAYQRAAKKLGIKPRELQSIMWEAIKSLMGDEKKTPELKEAVKNIWQQVQKGKLSPDQAREIIAQESGGFAKPLWMSDEDWEKSGEEKDDDSFDF